MNILEVRNLSKTISKKKIISDISFKMDKGDIVGFVGPNGAGKTTTLKLISSLLIPDDGEIIICGNNIRSQREKALSNMSAIIENPGLYKFLSGKDNMEFIRKINKKSKQKMDETIEQIGLKERINDTVKKYSLGMKQRLALGMCLLSEPRLLILDEPTNGLDPTGTMEFRNLILKLANEEKISILFSSHLLSEVDKLSNKIIFIKEGKLVSFKSNKEMVNKSKYKIIVENAEKAEKILTGLGYINSISISNKNELFISLEQNRINEVFKELALNELVFTDIFKVDYTLENEYSKIYKEG